MINFFCNQKLNHAIIPCFWLIDNAIVQTADFLIKVSQFQMTSKSKSSLLNNENGHPFTNSLLEAQQQKLALNEQRLQALQQRKTHLLNSNAQLQQSIAELRERINKKKEEENPVVKQLREHFKALREQLRNMSMQQPEGDDIDIDNMSYEQLLELGDTIGKVSKGLASSKFQALEKFSYQNELQLHQECTICRDEFCEEQQCIRLDCKHFFHSECLKGWVQVQKVCPNCKAEIR